MIVSHEMLQRLSYWEICAEVILGTELASVSEAVISIKWVEVHWTMISSMNVSAPTPK